MKVFKISGKSQCCGRWSELNEDFIGYFTKIENSDVIIGYMEEQNSSSCSSISTIEGIYMEKEEKIVFDVTNNGNSKQLLYVFFNLRKDGIWTEYDFSAGRFFKDGHVKGYAKVNIEEVPRDVEIERNIEEIYAGVLDLKSEANKLPIEESEYKGYLDIQILK